MQAETEAARAQLTDLAVWAPDRSRDAASVGELYATQRYGAMAQTIDMALDLLDDAAKVERWRWGVGEKRC